MPHPLMCAMELRRAKSGSQLGNYQRTKCQPPPRTGQGPGSRYSRGPMLIVKHVMLEWDAVLIQPLSTGDCLVRASRGSEQRADPRCPAPSAPGVWLVLEVASGSGEHIVHFASALPRLRWQPTDADPRALRSIAAHAHDTVWTMSLLRNPSMPARSLGGGARDAVLAINMTHIAPWSATVGLMAGAGGILPEGGLLYLYGPFRVAGAHTAPSNATLMRTCVLATPRGACGMSKRFLKLAWLRA